jgi:MYXO-CTERM domain-containing protein
MILLSLVACGPPSFETDSGQLEVADPAVVDLVAEDGGPSPLLVGTELCPDLSAGAETPEGDYDRLACFAQSFEGPVVVAGECLDFDTPGVVDWWFTAQACPGNDFGYAPVDDHVAIEVLAALDVTGHLPMRLEDSMEAAEAEEAAGGQPSGLTIERPEVWRVADGEPLRIVAREAYDLEPRLRTVDGVAVAWNDGALVSTDGNATILAQEEPVLGTFRVLTESGATSALALEAGGSSIGVGAVEGVPLSAVASLEIALVTLGGDGVSLPVAARAVTKDLDGNVIVGAPVKWRFTPMLLTPGPGSGLPGADYVTFSDVCRNPGTTFGEQRGRLTASLGVLSDAVEVVWTPRIEADPSDTWTRDEACDTACGCATGGAGNATALAALLGLAAMARRRG